MIDGSIVEGHQYGRTRGKLWDERQGKLYGTEYKSLAQFGNVKVVKRLKGGPTAPMETMTRGRVYATVDGENDIKYITFHDSENERNLTIEVKGPQHHGLKTPHVHVGYEHDENGTRQPNDKEIKLVERVLSLWERRRKKLGL